MIRTTEEESTISEAEMKLRLAIALKQASKIMVIDVHVSTESPTSPIREGDRLARQPN
jgi:hypothetical protein